LSGLIFQKDLLVSEHSSYLYKSISSFFDGTATSCLFASFLVFIQCLLINRICIKHKIGRDQTLVPGLIYATFTALLPDFIQLSEPLLATTFFIASLNYILNTYNNIKASSQVFLSSFFIGLAAIIYFPFFYFIFFSLISFLLMKSYTLKDLVQQLVGLFLPTVFLGSYLYFLNGEISQVAKYFSEHIGLNFVLLVSDLKGLVVSSLTILVVLFVLFNYGKYSRAKATSSQKKTDVFFWIIAFSGLTLMVTVFPEYSHLYILFIPLSLFISSSILLLKNKIVAEIIHLTLVAMALIIQFEVIQI
jgi:hypothetical protein